MYKEKIIDENNNEARYVKVVLKDIVQVEDIRTVRGEIPFRNLAALRDFRGNYGVPRLDGNNVIKGFFSADRETLEKLDLLHGLYVAELERYVPVVKTESYIDGEAYHLKQSFIQGPTFEEVLHAGTTDEIIEAYKTTLDMALNFVASSDKIVGIDQKPENWILSPDEGWMFLDTFPPFYTSKENRFGDIFYLRDFERDFEDKPERSFFRQLWKIGRRYWLKSNKVFDQNLGQVTLDVLRKYDKSAATNWWRYGDYK